MREYDLIVIGGGTAGLVSAAGGASLGARVALVERDKLGGECLYYGCVPSKALIRSAKVASLMHRAPEFGMAPVPVEVDFPAVMGRMQRVIEKAGEPDDPQRFRDLGVDVYLGRTARFEGPLEVSLDDGERLRGESVVLATGSRPKLPPVEGLQQTGYIDNVSVLELERRPGSVAIIGGGPIGCEYAQMFARFGTRVEQISSSLHPLPADDPELGAELERHLTADGVRFHGAYRAVAARREGNEKVVTARSKLTGREIEVRAEEILLAAGRTPNVEDLALENAGIELGKNGVTVDDSLMTTASRVYAAGDVVGSYRFTHAAEHQSRTALTNALFPVRTKIDYSAMPWSTFTDPEVAHVGLTERQAMEHYGDSAGSYTFSFEHSDRALCDGEAHGFTKIITAGGKVVGGHIIGPEAGNYISELTVAVKKGMKIGEFSTTIHVYPTLAESIKKAADNYNRQRLFSGPLPKVLKSYFAFKRRFL